VCEVELIEALDPTGRSAEAEEQVLARFAADIRAGLAGRPRQIPSRYFYDPLGSAIFDAICELPWYHITRAESRLLVKHRADLFRRLERLSSVIELGPGSGEKLKLLLDNAPPRRAPLDLHLVDVSSRALQVATHTLDSLPGVRIVGHVAEYATGLRQARARMGSQGRTLVLFLGSNIGNFTPPCAADLLESIRDNLAAGDALLLGTDLVKPEADLLLAYDDPLGVTAAFNRNLLVRINRELQGDFDLGAFEHRAVWNAADSRIEMHLEARSVQHVRIGAVPMELTIHSGERIWTESAYKYELQGVARMLEGAGFEATDQWIDAAGGFMLTLASRRGHTAAG
jgi:dimethylhistidine N-methyltransferase